MALQSDGETSEKRLCTDEEGNQGDATMGLALGLDGDTGAKRPRADVGVDQGDAEAALESDGDAGVKRLRVDGEANQGDATAEAALESDGDGSVKRLRVDEEANQGGATAEVALGSEEKNYISVLPVELKRRILTFLPLKSAIRMEVQSREWRHLWKNEDATYPSSLDCHLVGRTKPSPQGLLELLKQRVENRREHRLLCFSLVAGKSTMTSASFKDCLRFLARCAVEDLHIELRQPTNLDKVLFHLPMSSPRLARLSLRGVKFANIHFRDKPPFSRLEAIQLHRVRIDDNVLRKVLRLCPYLRVLDLHYCEELVDIDMVKAADNLMLRRLTVVECGRVSRINIVTLSGLRAFHYTGKFLNTLYLPRDALFTDLSICCDIPIHHKLFNDLFDNTLLISSQLTVLTICSNALQLLCFLSDTGAHAELSKLTELQLVMFDMEAANLYDIYEFLKNYHCPKLKRLFVQLPTIGNDNNVVRVPPEIGLENLEVVKIMNSNCNLVQLVSFLLRKASSLHRLLLVSSNVAELNAPTIPQADKLLLMEAVMNGQIILGDDDATQPFHSEVFP